MAKTKIKLFNPGSRHLYPDLQIVLTDFFFKEEINKVLFIIKDHPDMIGGRQELYQAMYEIAKIWDKHFSIEVGGGEASGKHMEQVWTINSLRLDVVAISDDSDYDRTRGMRPDAIIVWDFQELDKGLELVLKGFTAISSPINQDDHSYIYFFGQLNDDMTNHWLYKKIIENLGKGINWSDLYIEGKTE